MKITIYLNEVLKYYYFNQKVVELVINQEEISLKKIKEMLNIPEELVVIAVSKNKIIDSKAILSGENFEITLIPPINGG